MRAAWIAVVGLSLSASALAQPVPTSANVRSRALADAQRFADARRHADALVAIETALGQGEPMTPLIRRFITVQHYALGHWRETAAQGRLCVAEALQRPATWRYRQDTVQVCQDAVREALSHDASVTVHVQGESDGARVTIGQELTSAQAALGVAVTSGEVVIEATVPGRPPQRRTVTVRDETRNPVEFSFDGRGSTATRAPPVPSPSRPCPACATARGPGVAPWILVGTGVVALLGGAVATAFWRLRDEEFRTHCYNLDCLSAARYPEYRSIGDEAELYRGLTIGAFSFGAAALGSGVLWLLSERARAVAGSSAPRLSVVGSRAGFGLQLGATF